MKKPSNSQVLWLLLAGGATAVLWQLPQGNYAAYPFTILATWFHEMGHGLCALMLGGHFDKLVMFSDGSGFATHSGPLWLGRLGRAMVSAGGPLGPAIVGSWLLRRASRVAHPRFIVGIIALTMLLSLVLWVRSIFGIVAVAIISTAIACTAAYLPAGASRFLIQLLGLEACISAFHQFDYLFTKQVTIDGNLLLSDTGQIAQQLLLPYWCWGAILTATIVLLIIYGILANLEGVYGNLREENQRGI